MLTLGCRATVITGQSHAVTDERWLDAARRGDPAALERLYQDYQPALYRLCYRLMGNPSDAEDLLQIVFVQAFSGIGRFRGNCAVRTWLFSIAVRQAAEFQRRSRRPTAPLDDEMPSPDSNADTAERLLVQESLTRLSPEYRTVLVLRFWEELSYDEIARVLDLSQSAVKMRLHRARAAFRQVYEGEHTRLLDE